MFRDSQFLADKVGVPRRTIDQWRYVGKGPKYAVVGRHIRYTDENIDAWIEAQTVDPEHTS